MDAVALPVLVVDDNAENRALARATLEDDGYTVIVAKDGAEALAIWASSNAACILLDIQMPGIDGITVCERIRASPGGQDVAIVFVTAQRDIAVFDRALTADADDFLTKPFRPSDLVVRVQTAVRLRKLVGERAELYAEVRRQRDALQRLQLQKDQLAAFVVHDLKNPVNSIELQAERILRDATANDRGRSAAHAIRSEARALMRMLLNLLDLSRSDEGRLVANRSLVDLPGLVANVLHEHALAASGSRVLLASSVVVERELAADLALLHRVLANLVDNAIRYAPEDSTVRVTVVELRDAVELRVADSGTGIPIEQRQDIFRRFETLGGTRNRGLGLAFCKVAIEAHGGRIWVEDGTPGAVFCIWLPTVGVEDAPT